MLREVFIVCMRFREMQDSRAFKTQVFTWAHIDLMLGGFYPGSECEYCPNGSVAIPSSALSTLRMSGSFTKLKD